MSAGLRHPDQARVKAIVEEILQDRKRTADWRVEMMEFAFLTSTYQVKLSLDQNSAQAKIPSEVIDGYVNGDNHSRRIIKHALREAVAPFHKLED